MIMKNIFILLMFVLGVQFASSKDLANAKVGDYVYEDGTCYASKVGWAGKCVGVVISTTPNSEQIEMGYPHGLMVLLDDFPNLYQWWPKNERVHKVQSNNDWYGSDSCDYAYSYTYNILGSNSEAADACIKYPKIGTKFSRCFLPTNKMWKLMLENIGLLSPDLLQDNTDKGIDARKTCAARLLYLIGGFHQDRYDYWLSTEYGDSSAYFGYLSGTNNGGYWDSYDGRGRYTLDGKRGYVGDRTQRRRVRAMCYF